jgi:hypothetical protein
MDDPTLRCPGCRAFDWYHDGFVMHELPGGLVVRERRAASGTIGLDLPWSCAQCGYEVRDGDPLGRGLQAAQMAHDD